MKMFDIIKQMNLTFNYSYQFVTLCIFACRITAYADKEKQVKNVYDNYVGRGNSKKRRCDSLILTSNLSY